MLGRSAYDRFLEPPEPPPGLTDMLGEAGLISDEDWDWYDAEAGRWERLEKALEWAKHLGYIEAQEAIAEANYIEAYYASWREDERLADEYWRRADEDDAIDLIMVGETSAEEWRR